MADSVSQASETGRLVGSVLQKHNASVVGDPQQLANILADHLPRAEVNLLVTAARSGIPRQILDARADMPQEVLLAKLRNRMVGEQGFSTASAEWVVRVWSEAVRPGSGHMLPDLPQKQDSHKDQPEKRQTPPIDPPEVRPHAKRLAVFAFNTLAVLFVLGVITLVVLVARKALGPASYTLTELSLYEPDPKLQSDLQPWEIRNYNAWCELPGMKCAMITPFRTSVPYIHVRIGVKHNAKNPEPVATECTANNLEGQGEATARVSGQIPDPYLHPAGQSAWVVPLKAPEGGWGEGTYRVVCKTPQGEASANFKVKG